MLFPSRACLEAGLPKLRHHFQRFGAEIHVGRDKDKSKSECLFVAKPRIMYANPESYDGADLSRIVLADGAFIPIVEEFKYLGTYLTRDCTDDKDVEKCIEAAGGAFGALRDCLFSTARIGADAKRIVYVGLILSILLYGSECWCLTENYTTACAVSTPDVFVPCVVSTDFIPAFTEFQLQSC